MSTASAPEKSQRSSAPRWWRLSTGPGLGLLVACACGVILWASLAPITEYAPALIAAWVLTVLGAVWLALATFGWLRFRTVRLSLVAPALVIATVALVATSAPFWLGFNLSRDELTHFMSPCPASGGDRHVGVYRVGGVAAVGATGCRITTQGGLLRRVGLAYLPDGVPPDSVRPDSGGIYFEHLTGDWFRWFREF